MGIKSLFVRMKSCRPNYEVVYLEKENVILLKLANGTMLQQGEIADHIVTAYIISFDV